MTTIKVNNADLDAIETAIKDYFQQDDKFKNYNFSAGSLSAFIRVAKFVVKNLAYQLNVSVSELLLDTAQLEDVVYSLIKNYNYIPVLNRPAHKYLEIKLDTTNKPPIFDVGNPYTFKGYLNTIDYTSNHKAIPTLRDRWQESEYNNPSVTDFIDSNFYYFNFDKIFLFENFILKKYLYAKIPLYQGEWEYANETVNIATFPQYVELKDGSSNYYGDKVVTDSIRVFVKETSGTWHEYKDTRLGYFDEDLRNYSMEYDREKGIIINFDINHLCRSLEDTEEVRIFFIKTEGDDINEVEGSREPTFSEIHDFLLYRVRDGEGEKVYESLNNGSSQSPISFTDGFTFRIVDGNDDLTYLNNGVEKQSIDSIKKTAPLYKVTQGRAVTEADYNYILKNHFIEYQDIKAWGGQRELIDIESKIDSEIDSVSSFTDNNVKEIVKNVINTFYGTGDLTIESVDQTALENTTFRRDLGYVYLSYFNPLFEFVSGSSEEKYITYFLDKYKLLTVYYKFMDPIFTLLKPTITISVNDAYTKNFDIYSLRNDIYNFINENGNVKFNRSFDFNDLQSFLLSYDEIDYTDVVDWKAKLKVKMPSSDDEYFYVRTFTHFDGEVNAGLYVWNDSDEYEKKYDITTGGGKVYFDGAEVGTVNNMYGLMRIKTDAVSGIPNNEFYIDEISFVGNKINGFRENVIGIENVSDIQISLD